MDEQERWRADRRAVEGITRRPSIFCLDEDCPDQKDGPHTTYWHEQVQGHPSKCQHDSDNYTEEVWKPGVKMSGERYLSHLRIRCSACKAVVGVVWPHARRLVPPPQEPREEVRL